MYNLALSQRLNTLLWTVRETGEVSTRIWSGNLRERGHLEDLRVGGKIILKWITKKWNGA